jgi:hypothetical protein
MPRYLSTVFKIGLLGVAIYLIYQKVDWVTLSTLQIKLSGGSLALMLGLFATLFILNLTLDALSWQSVQEILRPISLKQAFLHNLKAYALAFITPFNSGELAARYLAQTESTHRQKALFLTFWAHAPKIFSKVAVAAPMAFFIFVETPNGSYLLFFVAAYLVFLFLYFSIEKVLSKLEATEIKKRSLKTYLIKRRPYPTEKFKLLILNTLRFLCFSGQMAVVLYLFKPEIINATLLASLPVYYLLAALVPTWAAVDFVIKGALSLYFFTFISQEPLVFAVASTLVWLFNVGFPALTGLTLFNVADLKNIRLRKD